MSVDLVKQGLKTGITDNIKAVIKSLSSEELKVVIKDLSKDDIKNIIKNIGEDQVKKLINSLSRDELKAILKDLSTDDIKMIIKDLDKDEIDLVLSSLSKDQSKNLTKGLTTAEANKLLKREVSPYGFATRMVSKGAEFCGDNKLTCGSVVGAVGLGAYAYGKNKKLNEREQQCMGVCLPPNWVAYESGGDKEIQYREIPVLDKDGNSIDFPQDSVCKSPNKDCYKFCEKKCHRDRNILNYLPGAKETVDSLVDTFKDIMESIFGENWNVYLFGLIVLIAIYIIFEILRG